MPETHQKDINQIQKLLCDTVTMVNNMGAVCLGV